MATTLTPGGLRRVSDQGAGISRRRSGKGFSYVGPDGSRLRPAELERVRSLAIPPAWSEVWICPNPDGHIQATGRDARRRKQYRYHARWARARDETKYDRMLDFAGRLSAIRRRVRSHLNLAGLPREKSLAAVVRLLDLTAIRVGNNEYARYNQSFGLTTMRRKHVSLAGARVTFRFTGKGRIAHEASVRDARVAAVVRRCLALPGIEVFKYLDPAGGVHDVSAADVNEYLKEISGGEFTAKDFRTWMATVIVVLELLACEPAPSRRARKAQFLRAVDQAAARLGNTRAICRKSYVHPGIETRFIDDAASLGRSRRPAGNADVTVLRIVSSLPSP